MTLLDSVSLYLSTTFVTVKIDLIAMQASFPPIIMIMLRFEYGTNCMRKVLEL